MTDSLLWGVFLGLTLLLGLAAHNWKRSQRPASAELQPNRLLTRYPLVFLSGKRSLFYFMGYWNQIPDCLTAHGYEVFLMPLPWSKNSSRNRRLHRFLELKSQQQKSFHLIIDSSSRPEMEDLLSHHSYSCLKSVTLIQSTQGIQSPDVSTPLFQCLSVPIEEITTDMGESLHPWFWKIHLALTSQSPRQSICALGFRLSESVKNIYLDRCQFLAERDLIQGYRSSNLKT